MHTRRVLRRFLFCSVVPLGVLASSAHAHVLDQAQPPAPDTIVKQFPAVPTTTAAPPGQLAQTDSPAADTTAAAAEPAEAEAPTEATAADNELAETGLINQDVLYAGLALLSLGAGVVLGLEQKRTGSASAESRA